MNIKVLKKIQACKASIKASSPKKSGRNEYSKYDYYTPEQVDALVHNVSVENALFNKYELRRDENGLYAQVTVVDLESGESEIYVGATEMPEITATNATQQMGGCMTYSERYMLMFIYGIKDNNLDPDSQDNRRQPIKPAGNNNTTRPGEKEMPWLNELDKDGNMTPEYKQASEAIKQGLRTVKDLFKAYKVSKVMQEKLRKLEPKNEVPEPEPYNDEGLPF